MRLTRSVCISLVLFAAGPLHAQQTAYSLGAQARIAAMSGKIDEAIVLYDKQITLEPDVIAYNARAGLKARKRDYPGALADYDKAIALQKPSEADNDIVYGNRASARLQSGDIEGAIADMTTAISLAPDNAMHYNNRGYILADRGRFDEAIADYSKAISLDPDEVNFHENRANARKDKRDLAGAIADYDELVEIEPEDSGYLHYRGLLRLMTGDPDRAIADFDKALAIAPTQIGTYSLRGYARQAGGDFDGAVREFDKVIALTKGDAGRAWNFREVLLHRLKRPTPFGDSARTMAKWKDGPDKDVGLYLIEAMPEADFLAKAAKGAPAAVLDQQCAAYYFIGMTKLLAGDQGAARTLFEKCLATRMDDLGEFILARAELARLGSRP